MAGSSDDGGSLYERWADDYFGRYESVRFEEVHRAWLDLLPTEPGRALDVGAGSGRDAAALADRGWTVDAVEPSKALRERAMGAHPHPKIQWGSDRLPGLEGVASTDARFDLILVSAVWMHLDPEARADAMARLRGLLCDGGRLVITAKLIAEGEPAASFPGSERGQRPVRRAEIEATGAACGLIVLRPVEGADLYAREVRWLTVALTPAAPRPGGRSGTPPGDSR